MRSIWTILKTSLNQFIQDDAMTLAGALAFFTALALAPLLILILWLVSLLGGDSADERIIQQVQQTVGPEGARLLMAVIEGSRQTGAGLLPKVIGIVTLLIGSTGVFAQLQYSLNLIWDVQAHPEAGLWDWLRKRVLTLGMVLAIAFVLLVSLVVSAVLTAVLQRIGGQDHPWLWRFLELGSSLAVYFLLFAATFKVLPDVKIAWRDVMLGSAITALLFMIGKHVIGLYLGRSGTESIFGAAGSFVVILLWVYFSSLILFFGAELTQCYVRHIGRRIEPNRHAVRMGKKALHDGEKPSAQGLGQTG